MDLQNSWELCDVRIVSRGGLVHNTYTNEDCWRDSDQLAKVLPGGTGVVLCFGFTVTRLSKFTNAEFSPRKLWGVFFGGGLVSGKTSPNNPRSKGSVNINGGISFEEARRRRLERVSYSPLLAVLVLVLEPWGRSLLVIISNSSRSLAGLCRLLLGDQGSLTGAAAAAADAPAVDAAVGRGTAEMLVDTLGCTFHGSAKNTQRHQISTGRPGEGVRRIREIFLPLQVHWYSLPNIRNNHH